MTDGWTTAIEGLWIPVAALLVSGATLVWGNELKRRTDRRVEREARMADALQELKAIPLRLWDEPDPEHLMAETHASWSFDWVVSRKKDLPVARWYKVKVVRLMLVRGENWAPLPRVLYATLEVNDILSELTKWRIGSRKPKWFDDEAARLEVLEEPLVPPIRLTAVGEPGPAAEPPAAEGPPQ